MLSIPRSPLVSPAIKATFPRCSRSASVSRPSGLQLDSTSDWRAQSYPLGVPIMSPTLSSPDVHSPLAQAWPMFSPGMVFPTALNGRIDYFYSPHSPPTATKASPRKSCLKTSLESMQQSALSPAAFEAMVAPPMSAEVTVTQTTFKAAELERRRTQPSVHIQVARFSEATFYSPRLSNSTLMPKRVHINPVVRVGSQTCLPTPLMDCTQRLEQVAMTRSDEERFRNTELSGGEAGEKYTLNMRKGTPVTTPTTDREFFLGI